MQENKPKFFGRRQGRKIRKAKTTLIEKFLDNVKFNNQSLNYLNQFDKIYMEIGFGNGEHLAGQAKNNPNIGFIGVEVFKNGVANLLSLITGIKEGSNLPEEINILSDRVDNIRVFDDDVRLLLDSIPDASVDKVFVLFPDPWPKSRHADRRIINQDNLNEIARILKPNGVLRIATDHKVYKGWALRQLKENQNFEWTAKCSNDWRYPPQDWVETKYQRKAIREGRKPVFFEFVKV